jgi:beta-lactamase regulating signal transducer with metallopeptidase domain/peptidoglycan/xylan/chitin deacetylase (PgdA/CDA1 family)
MQDLALTKIIGWTLLHSVWQGAIVAAALFVALRLMKTATANARYLTACLALCLLAGFPIATFVRVASNHRAEVRTAKSSLGGKDHLGADESLLQPPASLVEPKDFSGTAGRVDTNRPISKIDFEKHAATVLPFLVWLWVFGVLWRASRLSIDWWQLRKFRCRANAAISGGRFARLCDELKIRRAIKFIESVTAESAFTIGWLKPVVIVPTSAFLQLAPHELEAIIKHELAHIKRHDYLVNLVQSLVETIYFYHPATWWISANIRREREFACDDAVVELSDKIAYARALVNLEQNRLVMDHEAARLRLAAGGKNLLGRIKRIVESNDRRTASRFSAPAAGLAILITAALLINVSSTSLQAIGNTTDRSRTKKIAIGFVSIPPFVRTADATKDAAITARLLIEKLKSHRVPAIGFVSGPSVADRGRLYPAKAELVRLWRDEGFEIGIGGYRHLNFYETPYEEYVANVEKAQLATQEILSERNLRLRYFSYPYLNVGKEKDRSRFESWLKSRDLSPVKYTIDNQEWMYSFAYEAAIKEGKQDKASEIRTQFLDYMRKMFDYYEPYSLELFGREISQTMVLTPSQLVADSADDLFGMIKSRGYEFASLADVQADEAYQTKEVDLDSKRGISWLERWQLAQGKKLREEPAVSTLVMDEWTSSRKGN